MPTAHAADATTACSVISASKLASIFGGSLKIVTPIEDDRQTSASGGIQRSCDWYKGSKTNTVGLSVFGAGKGGSSAWDAKTEYDILSPKVTDAPLKDESKLGDAAVFRAEAHGDRIVVLSKTYVVQIESTLESKAGASEAKLIAMAKVVIPALTPALFTASKVTPVLFTGATATLTGAVQGPFVLAGNATCARSGTNVTGSAQGTVSNVGYLLSVLFQGVATAGQQSLTFPPTTATTQSVLVILQGEKGQWNLTGRIGSGTITYTPDTCAMTVEADLWKTDNNPAPTSDPTTNVHVSATFKCS